MARILGLFPAALLAARQGMSARAFYQSLADRGMAPRRGEAFALYKVAKAAVTRVGNEPFAPQSEVPSGADIGAWPSKGATGVVQTVLLTYRDKTTGQLATTWYRVKSDNGVTRASAVAQAIDAYAGHSEEYEQDLIGAVHTSAYRLTPMPGA